MKNKTNAIKKLALTALAGTSFVASNGLLAQMPSLDFDNYDARAKVEFQEFAKDSYRFTSTLGMDKAGTYAALPTAIGANVTEIGRMYQVDEFTPNGNFHYNALGIRPTFVFGDVKVTPLISANLGDKQQILGGLQLELNKNLILRAEGEKNLITDSTRLGTQIHYNPDNLEFSLGYDIKETPKKDKITQVFAAVGIKLDQNDYIRVAGAVRHQGKLNQNYLGGLYAHHGKEATFGLRTFGEVLLGDNGNYVSNGHAAIHTGKTTFGSGGSKLFLTDSAFDGGFGPYLGDGKLSVSALEAIPFYIRPAEGGVGLDFTWNVAKSDNIHSGKYGPGIFAAKKYAGWLFGASADLTYNFNDVKGNYTSINPGIFARAPKGKLEATLSAVMPLEGSALKTKSTPVPTFYTGVQWTF